MFSFSKLVAFIKLPCTSVRRVTNGSHSSHISCFKWLIHTSLYIGVMDSWKMIQRWDLGRRVSLKVSNILSWDECFLSRYICAVTIEGPVIDARYFIHLTRRFLLRPRTTLYIGKVAGARRRWALYPNSLLVAETTVVSVETQIDAWMYLHVLQTSPKTPGKLYTCRSYRPALPFALAYFPRLSRPRAMVLSLLLRPKPASW